MSTLRSVLPYSTFRYSFEQFMRQAEENVVTNRASGSRLPAGVNPNEPGKKTCLVNGGYLAQHFGQGAPSRTPYYNWHVLSIYYLVNTGRIIMGIEDKRYKHIDSITCVRVDSSVIGRKPIHVVYECRKDTLDYEKLYEMFMSTSEEILEHGL